MNNRLMAGNLTNVSAFFGNLRNSNRTGGLYEGFWGSFNDDNTVWADSRNGLRRTRNNESNPHVFGPQLEADTYYVVAGRQGSGTGDVDVEIFVNDSNVVSSKNFTIDTSANPSKLAIGTERDAIEHPGRESFDGELARFLIYERPLTTSELNQTISELRNTYFSEQTVTIDNPITQRDVSKTFDFESGDLQGATISQGVFGKIITDRSNFLSRSSTAYNKQGEYFLSTLETPQGGGSEGYTGLITSPIFTLIDTVVSLLVGGGSSDDLYFSIHLENGTDIYRTNRGVNSESVESRTADLSNYSGEAVYWQVGDFSTGRWGYIAVDNIEFTGGKK